MKCNHNRYKDGQYCSAMAALRGMKKSKVAWRGMLVAYCEDCGKDISEYRIVPYKTFEQVMSWKQN